MPCVRLLDICKHLTFLGHLLGSAVGLPCHRRRRRTRVDGHDAPLTIPLLLFCLLLASKLLYLALANFFGRISWLKRWGKVGEWVLSLRWKDIFW